MKMSEKTDKDRAIEGAVLGKPAKPKIEEKPDEKEEGIRKAQIDRQQGLLAQFSQPYIDSWGYMVNSSGDLILVAYDYSRRPQGVLINSKNGKEELKAILEKVEGV
jgi:hypothetical protein